MSASVLGSTDCLASRPCSTSSPGVRRLKLTGVRWILIGLIPLPGVTSGQPGPLTRRPARKFLCIPGQKWTRSLASPTRSRVTRSRSECRPSRDTLIPEWVILLATLAILVALQKRLLAILVALQKRLGDGLFFT